MDKKIIKAVLFCLIIFIVIIVLLNWLAKSQQNSRFKNEASNFNDYYKELLRQCGNKDKQLYNCCSASVELMAANNYKLASNLGCDFGYKVDTYECLGSFKWCELIR